MSIPHTGCLRHPAIPVLALALILGAGSPAAAQVVHSSDFEGTVGPEWSHQSVDTTPSGRKFLGQFGNDTVTLTLNSLPRHTYLTVSFDLFAIRSWDGSGENGWGPDIFSVGVNGGPTLLKTTISYPGCVINRQAYPQSYPGRVCTGGTGALERNTLGYTFRFPSGTFPLDAVYRMSFAFPHRADSAALDFSATGLQDLVDESWGLDNVRVEARTTLPGQLTVSPSNVNFGSVPSGRTRARVLRIKNTGRSELTGSTGLLFAPFRVAIGGGSFTLAPGKSRTVMLTVTPPWSDTFADLLVITSNDPRRPRVVVRVQSQTP